MLRKNPGYAIVAVLTLALGIGANTAIMSVISAVLFRPLPYENDRQIVVLHQRAEKGGAQEVAFSVPEIKDYRRQSSSFSSLVEYHSMRFTLLSKRRSDPGSRRRRVAGIFLDVRCPAAHGSRLYRSR